MHDGPLDETLRKGKAGEVIIQSSPMRFLQLQLTWFSDEKKSESDRQRREAVGVLESPKLFYTIPLAVLWEYVPPSNVPCPN